MEEYPAVIGPEIFKFLAMKDGKEVEALFITFNYEGNEKYVEDGKAKVEKSKEFIRWL